MFSTFIDMESEFDELWFSTNVLALFFSMMFAAAAAAFATKFAKASKLHGKAVAPVPIWWLLSTSESVKMTGRALLLWDCLESFRVESAVPAIALLI